MRTFVRVAAPLSGLLLALGTGTLISVGACGGGTTGEGGPAPPPGAGYGGGINDVRILSRDDCAALRDHQIEIAVASGAAANDPARRLEVESRVRSEARARTEQWVKNCSGWRVPATLLRCWRDATTTDAWVACDDAAVDAGSDVAAAD